VLASVTVFSLAMVLCAIAPGVTLFGIGRVLVGFGSAGRATDHRAGVRYLRRSGAM
jgi:MFS family permease